MEKTIADRYELGAVLASGGMATVWRARDTRLDRDVAVKRPHPTAPDDPQRARLVREARAAASITHPNIVTIFDAGEDDDGPYLVMELVEAPNLVEVHDGLTPAESIGVIIQVADALDAVHTAGIVHRDVKPSNILMPPGGPQLTDFGIAHDPTDTQTLTAPNMVMATPQYAAPEVLAGGKPTPSADVFSLAVVAYELLAGEPPFIGTERSSPAAPLGDPAIDSVLQAALSPDPALRPDAAELGMRLRGVSPTLPVKAVPTAGSNASTTIPMATLPPAVPFLATPQEDATSSRSRTGLWVGAAALALILLVAAAASTLNDGGSLAAAEASSTTQSTTTTSTTSSTTTSSSTTTTAEPAPTVESVRDELATLINAVHPSSLKPKDGREILKTIDEAIERASNGEESDKVEDKLEDAYEEIDKKVDGDAKPEILAKLDELAQLLGVEVETDD